MHRLKFLLYNYKSFENISYHTLVLEASISLDDFDNLMIDPGGQGALGESIDALLRMQIIPAGKPDTVVHKRALVLNHQLLVIAV